jgi:tripartite-type tricarboxylate transporter receptor subunit TctC
VIGEKRSPRFPEVPTIREAGYPGINVSTWFGILAPKKTPKEITILLNREVVKIIRSSEFLKQMEDLGIDVVGNSPEEMEAQIQEETERFRELVKVGKITVN